MAKAPCALCEGCPLFEQPFVPTKFVDNPDVIFVGEAPGAEEVRKGEPFVGQSGKLMDKVCEVTNQDFSRAVKMNVVSCRPPQNREPTEEEVARCRPRLEAELASIEQVKVVALGKTATSVFAGDVSKPRRGLWVKWRNKDVLPTWHPAYVLRKPSEAMTLIRDVIKGYSGPVTSELAKPPRVIVIDTIEKLKYELSKISTTAWIAFDIETDGLQYWDSKTQRADAVLMLALCYDTNFSLIITDEVLYDMPSALPIINAFSVKHKDYLVAHNGKFDSVFLRSIGIEMHASFDTMLAHYTLDETPGTHGLKELASEYFGVPDYESQFVKKYLKSKNDGYSKIPFEHLAQYAAWDVACTLALREEFEQQLRTAKMYEWPFKNLLMRASRNLTDVEYKGMLIDSAYLEVWGEKMQKEMDELTAELRRISGRPTLNPNAPLQISEVIYDQLRLPVPKSHRIKPRSTAKEVLAHIKGMHPFVDRLIEYRRISKLKGSYVDNLLGYVGLDGYVHATFKLMGTETGRLAVEKPALQTIPRPWDYYGKVIRGAFIAPDEDDSDPYVLLVADYSQAELRGLAHFSQDPFLLKVYREHRDLHDEGCNALFGTVEEVGDATLWEELRVRIKMFNFAWVYGGNEYSFAEDQGLPLAEARAFVRKYEANMPVAVAWKKQQLEHVRQHGYVDTPFGRRRRFALITSENLDEVRKAAVNAPIQGTASDLNLLAACELNEQGFDVCLLVHDSILVRVRKSEAEAASERIEETMIAVGNKYLGSVPWKADTKMGIRWSEPPAI